MSFDLVFVAFLTYCAPEGGCGNTDVPGVYSSRELAFMAAVAKTNHDRSISPTITIGNRPHAPGEHVITSEWEAAE